VLFEFITAVLKVGTPEIHKMRMPTQISHN